MTAKTDNSPVTFEVDTSTAATTSVVFAFPPNSSTILESALFDITSSFYLPPKPTSKNPTIEKKIKRRGWSKQFFEKRTRQPNIL